MMMKKTGNVQNQDAELKAIPCGECGIPIWYPEGASKSVCFTCPNCGHRECAGE